MKRPILGHRARWQESQLIGLDLLAFLPRRAPPSSSLVTWASVVRSVHLRSRSTLICLLCYLMPCVFPGYCSVHLSQPQNSRLSLLLYIHVRHPGNRIFPSLEHQESIALSQRRRNAGVWPLRVLWLNCLLNGVADFTGRLSFKSVLHRRIKASVRLTLFDVEIPTPIVFPLGE